MATSQMLRPALANAAPLVVAILLGFAGGNFAARCQPGKPAASPSALQELRLRASGAHGNESFLIASGLVARNVDGLFCLDSTTGKLTGFVLDPRTHKFTATFQASILDDLPPEQGKKPAYAMTIGRFDTISSIAEQQLGASLIYVADCNTGKIATYGFPRHPSEKEPADGLAGPFFRLEVAEPRKVRLREKDE